MVQGDGDAYPAGGAGGRGGRGAGGGRAACGASRGGRAEQLPPAVTLPSPTHPPTHPPVSGRVSTGAADEEAVVQNVAVGEGGGLGEPSGPCAAKWQQRQQRSELMGRVQAGLGAWPASPPPLPPPRRQHQQRCISVDSGSGSGSSSICMHPPTRGVLNVDWILWPQLCLPCRQRGAQPRGCCPVAVAATAALACRRQLLPAHVACRQAGRQAA